MNYSVIKSHDIADGPGIRVSLFVSGCRRHCLYCQNRETWDFDYGTPFDKVAMDNLLKLLGEDHIKGFTVLGGEPFEPENAKMVLNICHHIKEQYPEKDIWAYSGYTYEHLIEKYPGIGMYIDVLVDGPFIESLKDVSLRWRGSTNQRIIDIPKSVEFGKVMHWFNLIESDPEMNMKKHVDMVVSDSLK